MIIFDQKLAKLRNVKVLKPAQPVAMSNATIEDLVASMAHMQSDDRHPLSFLFPADGNGHHFVEFWSECPQIEYKSEGFDVFGVDREGIYLRKGDGSIHYAHTDPAEPEIVSIAYCNATALAFAQAFCRFQSLLQMIRVIALDNQDADPRRAAEIQASRDSFAIELPDALQTGSYWHNLYDRLSQNEYPVGKAFPYYEERRPKG